MVISWIECTSNCKVQLFFFNCEVIQMSFFYGESYWKNLITRSKPSQKSILKMTTSFLLLLYSSMTSLVTNTWSTIFLLAWMDPWDSARNEKRLMVKTNLEWRLKRDGKRNFLKQNKKFQKMQKKLNLYL